MICEHERYLRVRFRVQQLLLLAVIGTRMKPKRRTHPGLQVRAEKHGLVLHGKVTALALSDAQSLCTLNTTAEVMERSQSRGDIRIHRR